MEDDESYKKNQGQEFFITINDIDTIRDGKRKPTMLYYSRYVSFGQIIRNSKDKSNNYILPYIPPHPERGSGIHRIVICVGTIKSEENENKGEINRNTTTAELLKMTNGYLQGYAFFRTCWTRHVSQIYKERLGIIFITE